MKVFIFRLVNSHPLLAKAYELATTFIRTVEYALQHTPFGQLVLGISRAHLVVAAVNVPSAFPDQGFHTCVFQCTCRARVLRDFLLTLRAAKAAADVENRRWVRTFSLLADGVCADDLLSVAGFCQSAAHLTLAWTPSEIRSSIARLLPPSEQAAAFAQLDAPGDDHGHVRTAIANLLLGADGTSIFRASHVFAVNAREFLKALGSSILAIAISPPRCAGDEEQGGQVTTLAWLRGFAVIRQKVPQARFIVVGAVSSLAEAGNTFGPEFIFVRSIGKSLLDEIAIVTQCDIYVGAFDVHAVAAADAGLPLLIADEETGLADLPTQTELDARWAGTRMMMLSTPMNCTALCKHLMVFCYNALSTSLTMPSQAQDQSRQVKSTQSHEII